MENLARHGLLASSHSSDRPSTSKNVGARRNAIQCAFELAEQSDKLVLRVKQIHAMAVGGPTGDSGCVDSCKPADAVLPDLAERCESASSYIGHAMNLLDAMERELSR